jgi:hypothetical protein
MKCTVRPTDCDCARPGARRSVLLRASCLLPPLVALGGVVSPMPTAAQPSLEAAPLPAPFSAGQAGVNVPPGWEPVKISDRKTPTVYTLVKEEGVVVLHAKAVAAASGLAQFTVFDIRSAPVVEWRWKASGLIDGADNRVAAKEDAPARLVFGFDGDKAQLPLVERAVFVISEKLSGRELPYALLQYVWASKLPIGTVIEHPYTRRVRMIVVASGAAGVGKWQSFSRNLYDDYRHAFGEEPGNLIEIGVLTDTDNTGGSVEAWYGDIRFRAADR